MIGNMLKVPHIISGTAKMEPLALSPKPNFPTPMLCCLQRTLKWNLNSWIHWAIHFATPSSLLGNYESQFLLLNRDNCHLH